MTYIRLDIYVLMAVLQWKGDITQIKVLTPLCKSMSWFFYQKALQQQKILTERNSVISNVTKTVSFGLETIYFINNTRVDHKQLLYYDVRWLSRGENSCQEYLNYETSWPSFFVTKISNWSQLRTNQMFQNNFANFNFWDESWIK